MSRVRRAPWLFLAPFLAIYALFTFYPLIDSVRLSRIRSAGLETSFPAGWHNYRLVMTDPEFWRTLGNTAYFALGSLLIQLPVALGLALLLNNRATPARGV